VRSVPDDGAGACDRSDEEDADTDAVRPAPEREGCGTDGAEEGGRPPARTGAEARAYEYYDAEEEEEGESTGGQHGRESRSPSTRRPPSKHGSDAYEYYDEEEERQPRK